MFGIRVTHHDFVEATKCRIRMGGLHSWNVEMHIAYKPSVWFDRWIGAFYGGFRRNLWISLCYVVFWSIWNQHNRVVFDNGATNWEKLLFLMKLILGFWMKSRCPECMYSLGDVTRNIAGGVKK